MADLATISKREKLLAVNTRENTKDLVKYLAAGKERVAYQVEKAARNKRFATSRRIRDGLYLQLSREYDRIQNDLDGWTKTSIRRTSKDWHGLAGADLIATTEDARVAAFTEFSRKHIDDYFARIHPFNADKLAAKNVHLNPQLTRMLESDVRQLRGVVVDVMRQGEVEGLTVADRAKLMQTRTGAASGALNSWAFIDAANRRWKAGNYFAMLSRTVTANVARDSYHDALADEGRDLVQIIGGVSIRSHPACATWAGRVVSLTGATDGFPMLDEYIADGGFHPNCVHVTRYISEDFAPHKKIVDAQRGLAAPQQKHDNLKMKKAA